MVIYRIATSKNHIELDLLRVHWSPVKSETGFVVLILGKFWSRLDPRQRRNRSMLRSDRGLDHGLDRGPVDLDSSSMCFF
jgi:hypothetical protein